MWVFQPLPAAQVGVATTVNVTGNSVTASAGTVSTIGKATVNSTGNSVTVSVGTVGFNSQLVNVTGQSVTVSVGTVTLKATQVNPTGNSVTASVGSPTVNTLPTNVVPPSISLNSGYAGHYAGSKYTAVPGTWSGGGTVTGNWQINGANIPGATGLTYTLTFAQEGLPLRYQETNTGVIANSNALQRPALTPLDTSTSSKPPPTNNPRPAYLTPYTDPTFGVKITRISDDPGTNIAGFSQLWGDDVHHQYHKFPVWNADESLMFIETNSGSFASGQNILLFLDGQTYVPKYVRTRPSGWVEGRWDRLVPNRMVYVTGNSIFYYDVSTGTSTLLRSFSGTYTNMYIGALKGEQSWDNDIFPIKAKKVSDGHNVFFAYTISTNSISTVVDANVTYPSKTMELGQVSVSPNKNYLMVYFDDETAVVRTVDNNSTVNTWPETQMPAHHTLCVDRTGDGLEKAWGANSGDILKRTLATGAISFIQTLSYGYHTCATNYQRGAWIANDYVDDSGEPYYGEQVIIAHDGSSVGRICHNQRGTSIDYENEPHGSLSPTGKRLIFASTWRGSGSPSRPVGIYVADFRDRSLLSVETSQSVFVNGNAMIATAGNPGFNAKGNLNATGASATVSVGSVTTTQSASPTGQSVTVSVGTVTINGIGASAAVTGQQVTANVGTVSTSGKAVTSVTGNPLSLLLNGILVTPPTSVVMVTGFQLDTAAGSLADTSNTTVNVTGASMTCDSNATLDFITTVEMQVTGTQMSVSVGAAALNFGPSLMFAHVGTVKVFGWRRIHGIFDGVWTPIED